MSLTNVHQRKKTTINVTLSEIFYKKMENVEPIGFAPSATMSREGNIAVIFIVVNHEGRVRSTNADTGTKPVKN